MAVTSLASETCTSRTKDTGQPAIVYNAVNSLEIKIFIILGLKQRTFSSEKITH